MNGVNLGAVRLEIEAQIKRLETEELCENDFLRPARLFSKPMYPSEILELWEKLGIRRTMENYNEAMQQAVMYKREGHLSEANQVYINIMRNQGKLDKDYIWPWCKVMILAKDFSGLELLVRLLHAFNVRENIVVRDAGGSFESYEAYGSQPSFDFACNPALDLRDLCDSPLARKDEVEWRFRQYGGSEYWNAYSLNDIEYENFLKYFSLEKAGIKARGSAANPSSRNTAAATDNAQRQSGGCYIATVVYGSYDAPEVRVLRCYRDQRLATSWFGRAFIRLYYAVSPWLVEHFGAFEPIKAVWKAFLDPLVRKLRIKGYGNSPYSDNAFSNYDRGKI